MKIKLVQLVATGFLLFLGFPWWNVTLVHAGRFETASEIDQPGRETPDAGLRTERSSPPTASENSRVPEPRNPDWAIPIPNQYLKRFYKVSDLLYRGAQPTVKGMKELERLQVRTVINLRQIHSDRDELKDTSLRYEHIRMSPFHPEFEDMVEFLRVATQDRHGPFFVHCMRGADRTGTACAVYRIAVQGWSKDAAIEEMTEGGFGFHDAWNLTLIPFIRDLDVDALKREAGLKVNPSRPRIAVPTPVSGKPSPSDHDPRDIVVLQ